MGLPVSYNCCFLQVLKDPRKPQAKGNFWTVDVTRIPVDAMKLQNTSMTRYGLNLFVHDLSPFILHGCKYGYNGSLHQQMPTTSGSPASSVSRGEEPHQPNTAAKLNTSFMIDSLLHDLQAVDLPDVPKTMDYGIQPTQTSQAMYSDQQLPINIWKPPLNASSRPPVSSTPLSPRPLSSYSGISTISSLSSDDERERRPQPKETNKRPEKRPKVDNINGSESHPRENEPVLLWELPTSYTKCRAPNVVAPPSMCLFPFPSLHSLPYCNHKPSSYNSPGYWGLETKHPAGRAQKTHPPPLAVDLDTMLSSVPPNKSVFDVWINHPGDILHPAFFRQHLAPSSVTGYKLL
ncbi:hypothetical protein FKM82_019257 [Ascaphus truei]